MCLLIQNIEFFCNEICNLTLGRGGKQRPSAVTGLLPAKMPSVSQICQRAQRPAEGTLGACCSLESTGQLHEHTTPSICHLDLNIQHQFFELVEPKCLKKNSIFIKIEKDLSYSWQMRRMERTISCSPCSSLLPFLSVPCPAVKRNRRLCIAGGNCQAARAEMPQ